jgi:hypothetical protein
VFCGLSSAWTHPLLLTVEDSQIRFKGKLIETSMHILKFEGMSVIYITTAHRSKGVAGFLWLGVQTIEAPQAPSIREPKVPQGPLRNFLIEFVQISGVHLIVPGGSGPPGQLRPCTDLYTLKYDSRVAAVRCNSCEHNLYYGWVSKFRV